MVVVSPKINKISQMKFIFSPEYREGIADGISEALALHQELLIENILDENCKNIYHDVLDEIRDIVPSMEYYNANREIICHIVNIAVIRSYVDSLKKISHLQEIQQALNDSLINQEAKNDIDAKTRFDVLKRDCFRCVYCGENPVNNPAITLIASRIRYFTKWGNKNINNYKTLCNYCNSGKKNED